MKRNRVYAGILLIAITLLFTTTDVALAAGIGDILNTDNRITVTQFETNVMDFGSDINNGTTFTSEFKKIFTGMNTVFRSIITILTVAAAAMIAFGIEDGKKTVWQFMLGIGLAYNFGSFLWEAFSGTGIFMSVDQIAASHNVNTAAEILKNSKENGNDDILSEIMAVYSGTIVNNGIPVLQAIALRMTIALAALEGGYKIAMELYSGDKIKFIVATAFKCGFFCFLIVEWLNLGQALSGFFQAAGFLAAGESGFSMVDPTSADFDKTFRPDSIWHNAWAFLELCVSGKGASGEAQNTGFGFVDALDQDGVAGMFSITGGVIILPIAVILVTIAIVCALIFTSVEMFVARIEFYTMLMLSVVFLPFGVTERLAFLSNSAISLMFNSGAKMMVICFLQVMIAKIFSAYLVNLTANPFKSFSILIQMCVMSVFFAYITKKIPDLVSSFLNGSPALSGGGMMQQAKSMAATTATVVGAGVGAAAGAAGTAGQTLSTMKDAKGLTEKMSALGKAGAQFAGGTAWNLAKTGAAAALTSNSIAGGFAKGVKMAVGSDGSMANESFVRKVQDMAGLTDNSHKPILGRAMGKDYESQTSKSNSKSESGEDKKDKGGSGGKNDNGNGQNPVYNMPNTNMSASKKTTVNNIFNNMNQQMQNMHNQQMQNINNTNTGGGGDKGGKDSSGDKGKK